jgi:hypothetical protein
MDEVSRETWQEKMGNLMARRKAHDIRPQPGIDDYLAHFKLAQAAGCLGERIIDVGAGELAAKDALKQIGWKGLYLPIDPYPAAPGVVSMMAEDLSAVFNDNSFDTAIAFAVLDGVLSLDKTLAAISRVIRGHVLILTGIEIEPDRCHTHFITFDKLDLGLTNMKRIETIQLHPKVFFLIYKKELHLPKA